MMKLKSFAAGLGLAVLSLAPAWAQGIGQLGSGQMWANTSAGQTRGAPTNASAYFDFVYGSTRGAILKRGAAGWSITAPSATAGLPLASNGTGADPSYQTLSGAAFGTQSQNTFFGGPTSGAAANPTFRALAPLDLGSSPASHAVPVDVAGAITWKVVPDCQDTAGNHINYTQSTDVFSCGNTSGGGGGSSTIIPPQGRLTLVTATPVLTSNQTAKSTVFYDCYKGGNLVPYWNGSTDNLDTISSCEVSDAMVSAASAGQVVSGQLYDYWWVHGGANRICKAMSASTGGGGGWASDTAGSNTARGTGYSQLDTTTRPYITNKNSITNCFNGATNYGPVSANQGTYLGTFYATANGQTGMNFKPAAAAGGAGPILGLFNAYNQVEVSGLSQDNTANWTYTATPWRKANNSASNAIQFVDGLQQSNITGCYADAIQTAAAGNGLAIGIEIDWTSGAPTFALPFTRTSTNNTFLANTVCGDWLPVIGLHTINAVEANADGTNTATFYGNGPLFGTLQSQWLRIRLWM